jgi:hypothetical protein
MKRKPTLSPDMLLSEFDHGYWYAIELKEFAKELGVPFASNLRKDELEKAIRAFLDTGNVKNLAKRNLVRSGTTDLEKGLTLDLPVVRYTSNRETKTFLEREAAKIAPGLKRRSGARYRLNRWREEQLTNRRPITYRDLVNEYIRLNGDEVVFKRVPTGRYINFLSDYLANEPDPTHQAAIVAWKKLKTLNIPKDYPSWKKAQKKGKD